MSNENSNAVERWLLARLPRRVVVMGCAITAGIFMLVMLALIFGAIAAIIFALFCIVEMIKQGYGGIVLVIACVVLVGVMALMMYQDVDKEIPRREKKQP